MFSGVVVPGYAVMFEKGKEQVAISLEAFSVFRSSLARVAAFGQVSEEFGDMLFVFAQITSFQAKPVYRVYNLLQQAAKFRSQRLELFVERFFVKIIVQISHQMKPASDRPIAR